MMNRTAIEWAIKRTDRELGFLEGLIDADGSISLIKERRPHFKAGCTYKPRLNIANVCRPLLERAKRIIGAGCIVKKKPNPPHQTLFLLDVSAHGIRQLFPHIQLIVKERQRQMMLGALQILSRKVGRSIPRTDEEIDRLEKIYLEIRRLNGGVWNK